MSQSKREVPVYLITGFLDAGKTSFLKSVLTPDGLADGSPTLLFVCEEGEEEFDAAELARQNIRLITLEDFEDLSCELLRGYDRKYRPEQVLFELNGMWSMAGFEQDYLPEEWLLYQIVHVVDAGTFEAYTQNIASLMMEKLRNADMIVFNRCTPELKEYLRKKNLKMLNRQAAIYLDMEDGTTEDYDSGVPPFDLSGPLLDLSDDDYGVWYLDVNDHPERYAGTVVRYRGMVAQSDKFPRGSFVAGRFAMVCCANDAQFFGIICKSPDHKKFKNKDWVRVTGEVRVEKLRLFQGEPGPVLYARSVEACEPPEEELITF